jgi:hypothetical protein
MIRTMLLLAVILGMFQVPADLRAQDGEEPEYAVQLMYAVPRDGVDRGLDQDGTIQGSVESAQRWLEDQTGGRRLNLVTDDLGQPTVGFFQLSRTEDELNEWPHDSTAYQIEYELRATGLEAPGIIYAIYYEGTTPGDQACGEAISPTHDPGNSFTLYIAGICSDYPFLGADDNAGWWELTFMHEFFHAIGAVEGCAPNDNEGHVDDLNDLMYGGLEMWEFPVLLDVNNDDYYGHGLDSCYDGERSPYLVPHGEIVEPYPTQFIDVFMDGCTMVAGSSQNQEEFSEIGIINLRAEPVEITWLSDSGDEETLVVIDGWRSQVFSWYPGVAFYVLDEYGDCIGSFEMPDFAGTGVVWVMPDS